MENKTDWEFVLVIVIIFALFFSWVMWAGGYESGFIQGHRVARAYYEATGEMPSREWIEERYFHEDTKWRIFELLEEEAKK